MFRSKLSLALVIAILSFANCNNSQNTALNNLPVQEVAIYTAKQQSEQSYEELLGTVRAGLKATIEAKINGKIECY